MGNTKRKIGITGWLKIILRIVLLPVIIIWVITIKIKHRRSKNSDKVDVYSMSQIDSMTGEDFEKLLKDIFEKQGFSVSLTQKSHDFGADLLLKKDGKLSILQAKCYDKNIGIKAIQEVISAQKHYGADDMFVATNRCFSKEAIILAAEHGVKLIDRDVLEKLVGRFVPEVAVTGKKYSASSADAQAEIETKYHFWI